MTNLSLSKELSTPMQIVVMMTLLTLLPAIVMSITPFLRISIVLHFLRQALGTQSAPSNQVLVGLALFLTMVLIQPMAAQIYKEAWQPMEDGKITPAEAWDAVHRWAKPDDLVCITGSFFLAAEMRRQVAARPFLL